MLGTCWRDYGVQSSGVVGGGQRKLVTIFAEYGLNYHVLLANVSFLLTQQDGPVCMGVHYLLSMGNAA